MTDPTQQQGRELDWSKPIEVYKKGVLWRTADETRYLGRSMFSTPFPHAVEWRPENPYSEAAGGSYFNDAGQAFCFRDAVVRNVSAAADPTPATPQGDAHPVERQGEDKKPDAISEAYDAFDDFKKWLLAKAEEPGNSDAFFAWLDNAGCFEHIGLYSIMCGLADGNGRPWDRPVERQAAKPAEAEKPALWKPGQVFRWSHDDQFSGFAYRVNKSREIEYQRDRSEPWKLASAATSMVLDKIEMLEKRVDNGELIPAEPATEDGPPSPAQAEKPKCRKCGDRLTGHEDDGPDLCRWCVTCSSPAPAERVAEAPRVAWEYESVAQPGVDDMNRLGRDGWELCGITFNDSANGGRAFFKRVKK